MSEYSPDPLWSMADMPGETYQGWANRQTKLTYDWLFADAARANVARELASSCLSAGRAWSQQRAGSAAQDGQNDRTFAADEFARRLDLAGLVRTRVASPAFLAEIHFGQLLDAFLES